MSINVCNDRSMASITSLPSGVSGSSLVLISEQTASSSATIDFTSGIDSTYKEYIFKFINIHGSTQNGNFNFNMSIDNGSNYNVTKMTTFFRTYHDEGDSNTTLGYKASSDLTQSTSDQTISYDIDTNNDDNTSGYLQLFDPSNTTFVKHFIGVTNYYQNFGKTGPFGIYYAGYCNTTSAIDGVRFKMSSGNIDAGTIKMYGVS